MMAADMNDDPLSRSDQDHLTREAVLHFQAVKAMLKAAREMREQETDDKPIQQRLQAAD